MDSTGVSSAAWRINDPVLKGDLNGISHHPFQSSSKKSEDF